MTAPAAGRDHGRALGLIAWGAAGLGLLLVALAFVLGVFDRGGGPLGLEAQRRQLVALLDASEIALLDAETAARDADTSLAGTGTVADSAGGFMVELAATMRDLARSLRIDILGTQPFAGPANSFDTVARLADALATELDAAATSVRLAGDDMSALADRLAAVRVELRGVRQGLAQPIQVDAWRVLAAAILAWLAVPAGLSLGVGIRRLARDSTAPRAAATPDRPVD